MTHGHIAANRLQTACETTRPILILFAFSARGLYNVCMVALRPSGHTGMLSLSNYAIYILLYHHDTLLSLLYCHILCIDISLKLVTYCHDPWPMLSALFRTVQQPCDRRTCVSRPKALDIVPSYVPIHRDWRGYSMQSMQSMQRTLLKTMSICL